MFAFRTALTCLLVTVLFLHCRLSLAQAPAADLARSTGSPTTIYHGTDLEQVDTTNGNLKITLPLIHFPGRGLDTDVVLTYNSKLWNTVMFRASPTWPARA